MDQFSWSNRGGSEGAWEATVVQILRSKDLQISLSVFLNAKGVMPKLDTLEAPFHVPMATSYGFDPGTQRSKSTCLQRWSRTFCKQGCDRCAPEWGKSVHPKQWQQWGNEHGRQRPFLVFAANRMSFIMGWLVYQNVVILQFPAIYRNWAGWPRDPYQSAKSVIVYVPRLYIPNFEWRLVADCPGRAWKSRVLPEKGANL